MIEPKEAAGGGRSNRVGSGVSFPARTGLFAAAGALFSLPFAIHEMWSAPSAAFSGPAALVYLFAGLAVSPS